MPKKKKVEYKFKDWVLDSQGEVDFCWYSQELKDNGFVEKFTRGETKKLSDAMTNVFPVKLKTKTVKKVKNILQPHEYTYDFNIFWSQKGIKYFCSRFEQEDWTKPFLLNSHSMSFIENKPEFDFANMTRLVGLNIKWMWQNYGIFVQLVKNRELFEETFTPKAILKTKTGKTRVFKHRVKTLQEYLKTIDND